MLQKYSHPLNLSRFIYEGIATNFNVFHWNFMWQANIKQGISDKWQKNAEFSKENLKTEIWRK